MKFVLWKTLLLNLDHFSVKGDADKGSLQFFSLASEEAMVINLRDNPIVNSYVADKKMTTADAVATALNIVAQAIASPEPNCVLNLWGALSTLQEKKPGEDVDIPRERRDVLPDDKEAEDSGKETEPAAEVAKEVAATPVEKAATEAPAEVPAGQATPVKMCAPVKTDASVEG